MMFMSAYIPCSSSQTSQKLLGAGQHKLLSPTLPFGLYGAGDLLPHPLIPVPDMFYPLPLPPGLLSQPGHVTKEATPKRQENDKLNFGIDKILEKSEDKKHNTESDKDNHNKTTKVSVSKRNKMADILPPSLLPPQFNLSHMHPALGGPYSFTGQSHSLFESPLPEQTSRPPCPPKRKRSWSRAVFSALQRKGLEKRFEVQKYVTKPDRRQLAAVLGLTDAQVKVWFQNRRMKWRHLEEQRKKQQQASQQSRQTPQVSKSGSTQAGRDTQTDTHSTEPHVHVTDSEMESDSEAV